MTTISLVSLRADGRADKAARAMAIPWLPFVLGRHTGLDPRFEDPAISRRHCAFFYRDGQVWVQDLASANGTRLNGAWLTAAQPLAHGDRLQLAHMVFQVNLSKVQTSDSRLAPLARIKDQAGVLLARLLPRPC